MEIVVTKSASCRTETLRQLGLGRAVLLCVAHHSGRSRDVVQSRQDHLADLGQDNAAGVVAISTRRSISNIRSAVAF